MRRIFRRKRTIRVPNDNYKKISDFTEEDYAMIDLDRMNTGIQIWDDEYYYNYILYHNYTEIEEDKR